MSKRSNYSKEEKYQIISEVIVEGCSVNSVAKRYGLSWSTISNWIRKYNEDGAHGTSVRKSAVASKYEHFYDFPL